MFTIDYIHKLLTQFNGRIVNEHNFEVVTDIKSIHEANANSLVFIDANIKNKEKLILETKAITIICDFIPENDDIYKDKCLIIVGNPKLFFAKLVNQQLTKFIPGIHPTAVIDSQAKIANSCYIGPYVCIGNVEIGENVSIHSNCSIYDNVKIGNNVLIDAGCVIGAAGFGFVRDENGVPTRFPQLGGVIIEDDVEIGANVCIDRGSLQDTIIHKGVKIDNLAQIAHNVEIGKYTYIMGCIAIGGSTKIGERCWIAASRIINKVIIGDDVTIGFGAVVLKSIPHGSTYMGDPAMDITKYAQLQYKLKKL